MKPTKNILIVEDEHINRELLKIFLEQHYELTFAADFDTAVKYVDTNTFNLIITDIRLGNRLCYCNISESMRVQAEHL
jgi:CheY-like chemotaxis protein